MAPSTPALALALAFGVGSRLGDSFCLQNLSWANSAACCRRRPRPGATAVVAKELTAGLAAKGEEGSGGRRDSNGSGRYEYVLGQTAADTEGTDDEADALRRQVFANEKGFLESSAFNPARARAEQEEEEARALAAKWGSTPERAKEVLKRTKEGEDLSFQELEGIARELNLSDEQQRTFMLQASINKLSAATALPRRVPSSRVKEAVNERVFASEKGFLKNSAAFQSKLRVGSGVRFDAQGFPMVDDDDPVIQAAKKTAQPAGVSRVEGVTFPSLPDCPRCSTPTAEDELSQFGMCSQCKGLEISSKAYSGPQAASKYTYDNGDAPFSASWSVPPSKAITPAARDRPEKPSRDPAASRPVSSSTSSGAQAPDRSEAIPRAARPAPEPTALRRADSSAVSKSGGSVDGPRHAAAADAVAARTKAASVEVASASANATAATASPKRDRGAGAVSRGAAAAQRKPAAGATAAATGAVPVAAAAVTDARSASHANGVGANGGATNTCSSGTAGSSSAQVPASRPSASGSAAARSKEGSAPSASAVSPAAAGRGEAPRADEGSDVAFRKLRLEVAELRTHLVINRAALARVESMGGRRVGEAAAVAVTPAAGAIESDNKAPEDGERRDTALRKLHREVAELRKELSGLGDKLSDAVGAPPTGTRGGESEAVQKMGREVAELRSQLEHARKETALTRSALRRLQGEVDGLRKAVAPR
eukprot:g10655.t1